MKKNDRKTPYFPRVVCAISTSSKTFVDKKTRARHRRVLNRTAAEDA